MQAALAGADSTREAQLLESWKAYKRGFQQGIALFNAKPKKGIAFLQVLLHAAHTASQLKPSAQSSRAQFAVRSALEVGAQPPDASKSG